LIVIVVPTVPLVGENEETVGGVAGDVTVKFVLLGAEPAVVTTRTGPVVAELGTVAVI
jgi:hypothetical protein